MCLLCLRLPTLRLHPGHPDAPIAHLEAFPVGGAGRTAQGLEDVLREDLSAMR